MKNFHIQTNKLNDAITVSLNISEFEDPYEMSEYSKRLVGAPHYILTVYDNLIPIAFKIGYQRYSNGSFYSWRGEFCQIIAVKGLLITWLIIRRHGQRRADITLL